MLNRELLSQPTRIELLGAQRDKETLELSRKLDYVAQLEALVTERRLSEAETAKEVADETARQAFGKHPLVQEIAAKNTQLGDQLNSLAAALESITSEENKAAVMAKRVADNFRLTRQKLEIAGLSEALRGGAARTTARIAGIRRLQGRREASTAPGHRIQPAPDSQSAGTGPIAGYQCLCR